MTLVSETSRFKSALVKGAEKAGLNLESVQLEQLTTHAAELMSWNKKMNLTAIRKPELIAEKHFLDALAVSRFITDEKRVLDMGSGGGFPAIPIKVMHPDVFFILADAVRKKVTFLNHVIRTLGLKDIRAEHARVEEMARDSRLAGTFDIVVSRGFAHLDTFVSLSLPMLRPGGSIWALKGAGGDSEISPELKSRFCIRIDEYVLPSEGAQRMLIRLQQI